jgi:alcohol dehydrogenase (cytochrome c)
MGSGEERRRLLRTTQSHARDRRSASPCIIPRSYYAESSRLQHGLTGHRQDPSEQISKHSPLAHFYVGSHRHTGNDVEAWRRIMQLAMIPVLFEGQVGGQTRPLVAIEDKAGNFVLLDRMTGKVVHRLALITQVGLNTPPSRAGTEACPNHGGGIEWNGGAYDPNSNSFLIPSTDECAVWSITGDHPQHIAGQPYTGGPFPPRHNGTGVLTSVDVSTGELRWRKALPYPAQGGVLITATGLAFTSDVGGNIYAFDAASGREYWRNFTGSAVLGPTAATGPSIWPFW